jgi:hypothetical protein
MLQSGAIKTNQEKQKMKVVKHYEYAKEDEVKMLELWNKYLEKAAKTPKKYPRYIFGPAGYAQCGDVVKGVSIMEIDNDEQLVNYMLDLSPPLKAEFTLLFDTSVYVPAYLERQK